MKIFAYSCLALVAVFLLSILGLAFGVISLPFHTAKNIVNTAHNITDKTINADNAIYNYEWFKQQYEDIKGAENKIVIAHAQVESFEQSFPDKSKWGFEDKNEYNRLRAVEQGIKAALEDMVATYNARSKMANRVIFRDGLIPEYLEFGKNILTNF